ncbi:MAG: glutathione S-transferase N-terminal domain-containing protein [Desulfobacteraceae bacterium]|nr:glutathione S-transferase N-terminal domain-containing protein [Desulfobacteraceae bacterium]
MSELTLVIGNKNYSSWSLRPWIYMKNMGIKFTEKRIPLYMENTTKLLEPYFSGYKVPVLMDGSLVIWDSLAILEYLAERYPDCNGWPTKPDANLAKTYRYDVEIAERILDAVKLIYAPLVIKNIKKIEGGLSDDEIFDSTLYWQGAQNGSLIENAFRDKINEEGSALDMGHI